MAQDLDAHTTPTAGPVDTSLLQRTIITLAALLLAHACSWIPLPGIEPVAAADLFETSGSHLPFQRLSMFMLGLIPMLSALILAETAMLVFPELRQLHTGQATRHAVERGILSVAFVFAAIQAWGMAIAFEDVQGLVTAPGPAFRIMCIASMVGATGLLAWLASIITKHGLGSGFWLLLLTPALAGAASLSTGLFAAVQAGNASAAAMLVPLVFMAAVALALTALERTNPGAAANAALIWPAILATAAISWLLVPLLPFLEPQQFDVALQIVAPGQPLRMGLLAVLVPLLTLWRHHSLVNAAHPRAALKTPLTVGLVLAAILLSGDALVAWSGLPAVPDAKALIIAVTVAIAILQGVRTA
ncbi:MAG: hypothetical protein ABL894_12965 [Hyphomicrobium sp.]